MSDKSDTPDADGPWVPSADQPVPPTTEFAAVRPEGVEPISGPTSPDETDAPAPADAPAATEPPVTPIPEPVAPQAGSATAPPAAEAPAWKTPAASGLPPQWGTSDADDAQASGPQPTNSASNLWGLVPEDRPEVLLGVALAGGVLAAILVRTLARR